MYEEYNEENKNRRDSKDGGDDKDGGDTKDGGDSKLNFIGESPESTVAFNSPLLSSWPISTPPTPPPIESLFSTPVSKPVPNPVPNPVPKPVPKAKPTATASSIDSYIRRLTSSNTCFESTDEREMSISDFVASIRRELKSSIITELKSELRRQIKDELRYELLDEFKDVLRVEMFKELKDDLRYELRQDVISEMENRFYTVIRDDVKDELVSYIRGKFTDEFMNNLDNYAKTDLADEVSYVVMDEVNNQLDNFKRVNDTENLMFERRLKNYVREQTADACESISTNINQFFDESKKDIQDIQDMIEGIPVANYNNLTRFKHNTKKYIQRKFAQLRRKEIKGNKQVNAKEKSFKYVVSVDGENQFFCNTKEEAEEKLYEQVLLEIINVKNRCNSYTQVFHERVKNKNRVENEYRIYSRNPFNITSYDNHESTVRYDVLTDSC